MIPNQIYQIKSSQQNLPNQIYKTKSSQQNLPNQFTKPILLKVMQISTKQNSDTKKKYFKSRLTNKIF